MSSRHWVLIGLMFISKINSDSVQLPTGVKLTAGASWAFKRLTQKLLKVFQRHVEDWSWPTIDPINLQVQIYINGCIKEFVPTFLLLRDKAY